MLYLESNKPQRIFTIEESMTIIVDLKCAKVQMGELVEATQRAKI